MLGGSLQDTRGGQGLWDPQGWSGGSQGGSHLSMWILASMWWLRSCSLTRSRARVENLLAVRSTSGRFPGLGVLGCCSTTKALGKKGSQGCPCPPCAALTS